MIAPWPKESSDKIDEKSETDMVIVMDVIRAVRNILSEMNVPPSSKAEILIQTTDNEIKTLLGEYSNYIYKLANASNVIIESNIQKPESSATVVISGGIEVYIPLAELIDIEKEKDRLRKNLDKAISDLDRIDKRLANEEFTSKAPENIVAKERERKAEIEALKVKLQENLKMIG
jgi:valyl-tRNA synthetase